MTTIKKKRNRGESYTLFGKVNALKKCSGLPGKSLKQLTVELVEVIKENNGKLDLNKAATILDASKNRLYDVVNVLEGVGCLQRTQKMLYWCMEAKSKRSDSTAAMNTSWEVNPTTSTDYDDNLNKCENSTTEFIEFAPANCNDYNMEYISVTNENLLANTSLKRTCGLIDITNDSEIYNIQCSYCGETFSLQNWMIFVSHIEEQHYSRDDHFLEVNNILKENHSDTNEAEDFENIMSSDDKSEIFKVEYVSEASNESQTEDYLNDGEIENKNKVRTEITFKGTDGVVVLNFLELLKEFPILWPRRQISTKPCIEALITITKQFNERYELNYTAEAIRSSLQRIRTWYQHALDMKSKANLNYKEHYIEYFQKCAEFLPKFYCCNICMTDYRTEEQLQKHADTCSADGQFICELCGKKSNTKAVHKLHVQLHGEPQHRCNICNKGFHRMFLLKEHMKMHRNERDYVCEECGKSFIRQKAFKSHKQSAHQHMFVCGICNKKFSCRSALEKHRRTMHIVSEGTIEELATMSKLRKTKHIYVFDHVTNKKRIKCMMCDKTYTNHEGLRGHILTKHCEGVQQQHCKIRRLK